jgi:hypothetical protein
MKMEQFLPISLGMEAKGKGRKSKKGGSPANALVALATGGAADATEKRYLKITYHSNVVFVAIQKKAKGPAPDGSSDDANSGRVYMAAVCDDEGQPGGGKLQQLGVDKSCALLRTEVRDGKNTRLIFERAVKVVDDEWVWCTPGVGDLSDFELQYATKEQHDAWEAGEKSFPNYAGNVIDLAVKAAKSVGRKRTRGSK